MDGSIYGVMEYSSCSHVLCLEVMGSAMYSIVRPIFSPLCRRSLSLSRTMRTTSASR